MSDRTSPVRNDILVSGYASDGTFCIKFMDIEDMGVLDEFSQFIVKACAEYQSGLELTTHLEEWYEKPSGWFTDCFINNAFMGALDSISHKLCGKCFCQWHDKKTIDKLAIQVLMWCAFLAEKYGTKEEPEIYSEFLTVPSLP